MSKEIKIFKNNNLGEIRIVLNKGSEPYFVAKDVAKSLGYINHKNAIKRHVFTEDTFMTGIEDSLGRIQDTVIINESGLYSLILSSKLERAKEFKRWVTSDVLPSIRKYGLYATDELLDNPDLAIQVFKQLKEEKDRRLELENQIEEDKEYTSLGKILQNEVKKSISIGAYCKLLKNRDINIGRNTMFKWLRENGYLIMSKGRNFNNPKQQYMDMDIFELAGSVDKVNDKIYTTTLITPKGQTYIYEKLLKSIKEETEKEEVKEEEESFEEVLI